ncbi:hypothetical protein Ac2012v2_006557 [Leucoagaricus gongylophorus]
MYNLLTAIISSYIILQSSGQATPGYLRPGDTCATIVGPTQGKCAPDLNCCFAANDHSICYKGRCPTHFIPERDLCDGFMGPVDGECWPGTSCCNLNPDNFVCLSRCP